MKPEIDPFRLYWRKLQRHPAAAKARIAVRMGRQLLPNLWRQATHRYRQLPGAVVAGMAKAGTTQLYSYLIRHPRCFGGRTKEFHYFTLYADRSLAWYRAQFPLAWRVARVGGVTIDASPSYMASPDALARMASVLPEAKVIVLVREPIARAFSHYQHEKTRHRETRSFLEVVRDTLAAHQHGVEYSPPLRPDGRRLPNYIARSYYAMQLEWLWRVYPRGQVLVLDSGDLFADTNAVCQRVFEFLGLERFDVQPDKIYNRGYYREKIEPEAAELLREHFRPHDEKLAALLGRPLSWMRPPAVSRSAAA